MHLVACGLRLRSADSVTAAIVTYVCHLQADKGQIDILSRCAPLGHNIPTLACFLYLISCTWSWWGLVSTCWYYVQLFRPQASGAKSQLSEGCVSFDIVLWHLQRMSISGVY